MYLWCRVQECQATQGQGRASGQESVVSDRAQCTSRSPKGQGRAEQGRGGRDAAGLIRSAMLLAVATRLGVVPQGVLGTVATESAKPH